MISVINHHVSIVHLRIHDGYLQCLASDGDTTRLEHKLQLQRSKWFDFFDQDDRVSALRGIWGVLAWLTRG